MLAYGYLSKATKNTQSLKSFGSAACALYNVVLPSVKEPDTLTSFKSALDPFLRNIPDTPPMPGYVGGVGW